MERKIGIWMDSSKAIIVSFNGRDKEEVSEIESNLETRLTPDMEGSRKTLLDRFSIIRDRKKVERKKHQLNSYFKNVSDAVKNADELYIFGPAETKKKFKQALKNESKQNLNKIVAIESADSMTLNQVVARVKAFFRLE